MYTTPQIIVCLTITLILLSCAQIVPLSGGEKDIEAPKEIESLPQNGSINFAEKTIEIKFDEFIQLNNLSSQLLVSPVMENPPEVLVKGKRLVIKISDELAENTTYSINFGNAITDITENNAIPNYKYVFSTGSYLDSLSYSGSVVDAFDLSTKENIYVLLYDQFEDSIPLKAMPRYIAMTDKQGVFSITNIAHGEYKFFAINDINSNYIYDLPNEMIGFKPDLIQLDSSINEQLVCLFEEENQLQYVDKAENKVYGKVDIILNLPTEQLSITPLNQFFKQQWYLEEKSKNGDSLTLWLLTTENVNNFEMLINDGKEVIDTLDISILGREEFKDSLLNISTNVAGMFNLNTNIVLELERPFSDVLLDSIQLYEDSILVKTIQLKERGLRKFELAYDFKENTSYQLFVAPGTFTDIYNLKNDTLSINFMTKKLSNYGNIFLKINPNFSEEYIVQLFKKDKLIQEDYLMGKTKVNYNYLLPGNYGLKLIIDSNGDQEWNTGNYLDHLQPEKVIFYEKEIIIRANWDNDIDWVINE